MNKYDLKLNHFYRIPKDDWYIYIYPWTDGSDIYWVGKYGENDAVSYLNSITFTLSDTIEEIKPKGKPFQGIGEFIIKELFKEKYNEL